MENLEFRMIIEDILHIRQRGLVIIGQINNKNIKVGDTVYLESEEGKIIKQNMSIDGLEVFNHTTMNIGILFKMPYTNSLNEALETLPIKVGDVVKI